MLATRTCKIGFEKIVSAASLLLVILIHIQIPAIADAADKKGEVPLFKVGRVGARQSEPGKLLHLKATISSDVFNNLKHTYKNSVEIQIADENIIFEKRFQKQRTKTTTWRGENKKRKSQILLTLGADHLFGIIWTQTETIHLSPTDTPFEINYDVYDEGFAVPLVADALLPHEPDTDKSPAEKLTSPDDGTVIDVMVLYTNGLAGDWPGTQIYTRIQFLIDTANTSYTNSLINTELNLVYTAQVSYTDDSEGGMNDALDDLTYNNGVFAGVESLRTTYGADQVTLLRRFVDEGCGLAWLLSSDSPTYSYAVVHDGSKTDGSGYYCDTRSYVHEIGHNMGCTHDLANASGGGRYSYSYGYQEPSGNFRTVMAYSSGCTGDCPRISYFSNPNVSYDGIPTGTATADNAQTINNTRTEMSAFRTAVAHTITCTSPNGGESYQLGQSVNIQWSSTNITGTLKIELYKGGTLSATIASSTTNDGSYSWKVPNDATIDDDYIIRITSLLNPAYFDSSNNAFGIAVTEPEPKVGPAVDLLLLND